MIFAEPFLIKCESDNIPHYWKEEDGGITTTTEILEATKFCVDIIEHPNVISLETFQDKGPPKRLTFNISRGGTSPKDRPPALRPNSDAYGHKLSLKDPMKRKSHKTNPDHWISEEEEKEYLYIRCVNTHLFGVNGKFCMKLMGEAFQLTIVPKTREHNGHDMLMLFKVHESPQADD